MRPLSLPELDQTRNFYRDLVDRAKALPGVTNVALASSVPLNPEGISVTLVIPDHLEFSEGQDSVSVSGAVVDEHYFDTMQTEIVRGRAFTVDDTDETRRVAIVNETFAQRYWPDEDPIGNRLTLPASPGPLLEIVGVARNGKCNFIAEPATAFLYRPFAQSERTEMSVLVEVAAGNPVALARPLGELVRSLDPELPVFNLRSLSDLYEERAIGVPRFILQLVGTLGGLGLSLALVGLYGLVAYTVARQTREIGIRMVTGATRGAVLRQGFLLAAIGVLIGGAASAAAAPLLLRLLSGIAVPSLMAPLAAPVLLIVLSLAASYVPSRRASLLDPARTLRAE